MSRGMAADVFRPVALSPSLAMKVLLVLGRGWDFSRKPICHVLTRHKDMYVLARAAAARGARKEETAPTEEAFNRQGSTERSSIAAGPVIN